jgi:hypothetical protein
VLRNVIVKGIAIHGDSEHNALCHSEHNILCHGALMTSSLESKQRGTETESTNDVTKLLVTKEVK